MDKITSETKRKHTFLAEFNPKMDYSETKISGEGKTVFGYGYDNDMKKANEQAQKEAAREWKKKNR
jgi:uncharacterized FlgJ-related protein